MSVAGPASASDDLVDVHGRRTGGFSFENWHRNKMLMTKSGGLKLPKAHKTGTTIVGVVYKDGVVLGADTRATEGETICDKNCEKIHYIAPNIWCCGAGTSADTENVTAMVDRQLQLLRLATGTQSRVVTAMTRLKRHLFGYQGHVSAALILGGVDATGPHLYTVYPHGSTDKLPFVTMGSGSLAAMSIFETGYKDDMTEIEARDLVHQAIRAGIFNDLGSGNNVDIHIIRKATADKDVEVVKLRNFEKPNEGSELRAKIQRPPMFSIPKGATTVIKTDIFKHLVVTEVEDESKSDSKMDIA